MSAIFMKVADCLPELRAAVLQIEKFLFAKLLFPDTVCYIQQ